jgi:hypothetical protein
MARPSRIGRLSCRQAGGSVSVGACASSWPNLHTGDVDLAYALYLNFRHRDIGLARPTSTDPVRTWNAGGCLSRECTIGCLDPGALASRSARIEKAGGESPK